MSVPFKEGPGGSIIPDVEAVMQGVRGRVADKLRSGAETPATLEEVRRIERGLHDCADAGPAPGDDLARLQTIWDPLGPHAFVSHRTGVGTVVVELKQLLRRLVRPVAAVVLPRQTDFNGAVARLLTRAFSDVQSLASDNDALTRRLEELERDHLELRAEIGALKARSGPGGSAHS